MNVITLGTFDLWHEGHVRLVRRCREIARGGRVTVALNLDEFVASFKGRAPVIPYADRAAVIAACRYVDEVVPNCQLVRGDSAAPVIVGSDADRIVVGSDWQDRDYLGQLGIDRDFLDRHGIAVVYVPYGPGRGSTGIRARVLELAR